MRASIMRFLVALITLSMIVTLSGNTRIAQAQTVKPLKVVQLGDSYSAGNGARSASDERNYSGVSGCYRSPTNWGSQFVEALKDTYTVTYINRACSGGVIKDILKERVFDGALDGIDIKLPFQSCRSAEYPDEEEWKETTSTTCRRYLKPQINAIDSSVDLVVMTMGGNDAKFDDIVKRCFVLGLHSAEDCRDAVQYADGELDTIRQRLVDTFGRIRSKLRTDARVILVSYPYLLPEGNFSLRNDKTKYTYNVSEGIRTLEAKADISQRAAVELANTNAGENYIVFYEGTKELFKGHEPDPSTSSRNPDRWLHEFDTTWPAEWYHFNPLGHQNLGSALSGYGTFGAGGHTLDTDADIDVAFVVDTTGSMGGVIAQVRADLSKLVDQLAATTNSYRVAVVSYRDFPERTGWSGDYPSRVDQTFTQDRAAIQAAIDSLTANGGGDLPETVFSGVQSAIGLPWRPGVTKIAIVIGDAPALSPEPISNLTADQIIANSIAIDPVKVIGVNTGDINSNGAFGEIASGTGGSIILGTSELTTKILEILNAAAKQPFAWLGTAYSGKVGHPVQFDASGSYDPSGSRLSRYEWDFDGDGVFDLETAEATASHIYDTDYNNYVVLRVTGPGGTALASARTVVNSEGFASQGDEVSCELDENGYSIIVNADGQFIRCTPDHLPTVEKDGVIEISGALDTTPPVVTIEGVQDGAVFTKGDVLPTLRCLANDGDGSGIASINGPELIAGGLNSNGVGSVTYKCTATDVAGNSASATATYSVKYNFGGFLPPIYARPSWNAIKAGSAVPIKFSLHGNQGLGIFAASYPKVQIASCTTGNPTGKQAVSPGGSKLSYDVASDIYTYVWQTDKSWGNRCVQLQLKLNDGQQYNVNFTVRK